MTRARVWAEAKPFVAPAVVLVIYAILRAVQRHYGAGFGLLTPDGTVDDRRAGLALATLALRFLVLTGVTFVVTYRLAMRGLRALPARVPAKL